MTQGFFFLVFVIIGVVLILQWLLSSSRRQETGPLRRRGTRVAAVVSAVVQCPAPPTPADVPLSPDPSVPATADRWYIECQWTDPRSDAVYTFRSDDIDAATAHHYTPGSPIAVLIAPGAPDNYFVEVIDV